MHVFEVDFLAFFIEVQRGQLVVVLGHLTLVNVDFEIDVAHCCYNYYKILISSNWGFGVWGGGR